MAFSHAAVLGIKTVRSTLTPYGFCGGATCPLIYVGLELFPGYAVGQEVISAAFDQKKAWALIL